MDNHVSWKLKNFETVNWLKNRFKNQVKDKYILNDRELKEQTMMKAVFKSIDRDKSKFLDRQELYDMFKKYGINITKMKLREFFKRIDQDEDDKLNWNDFKQALQNQEALQMFVELMRKIRESTEKQGKKNQLNFVPLSFPNMIQYMNYCVLREEMIQKINSDQLNTQQKVKQCKNLLSLEDLCYRNICQQKEDDDEGEQEEIDIAQYQKKNDHQQLAILKRLQEKEEIIQRKCRIRKLSMTQHYKSDTEQTNRSIKKQYISQRQDKSERLEGHKQQMSEFKLIEHLTSDQQMLSQNEVNLKPIQMIHSERINVTDNPFQYRMNKPKKQRIQQPILVPKGSHFTNQYFINTRSPAKMQERVKLHTPKRIRIISQTDLQRTSHKSQF